MRHRWLGVFFMWLLWASVGFGAPQIWFEDNNLGVAGGIPADFADRFQGAFKKDWEKSRAEIAVHYLRVSSIRQNPDVFTHAFLHGMLQPVFFQSGMQLAFDTGDAFGLARRAQKAGQTIEQVLKKSVDEIQRFKDARLDVKFISMQSQLSRTLMENGAPVTYSFKERIDDAIAYVQVISAAHPGIAFGILDALPTQGKNYEAAYRTLAIRMKRETGLDLHHIHLDLPEEIATNGTNGMSWQKAVEVEQYVRGLGVGFGITFASTQGGKTSGQAYHERALAAQQAYADAGGSADFIFMTSFYPFPEKSIPEEGTDYTTLRTVLEISRNL